MNHTLAPSEARKKGLAKPPPETLPPHGHDVVPEADVPKTPDPTEKDLDALDATAYFTGSQSQQPLFECKVSTPTPDTYLTLELGFVLISLAEPFKNIYSFEQVFEGNRNPN